MAVIFLPMLFSRQDEQRQVVVEAPAAPQAPNEATSGCTTTSTASATDIAWLKYGVLPAGTSMTTVSWPFNWSPPKRLPSHSASWPNQRFKLFCCSWSVPPDVASFGALAQMDAMLAPYLEREKPPQRFYVINQLDAAHRFSLDMAEVFKTRLGSALLGTVHRDLSFSEAQAYGRDPLDPTVNSIGCQDVLALCRALLERLDSDLP